MFAPAIDATWNSIISWRLSRWLCPPCWQYTRVVYLAYCLSLPHSSWSIWIAPRNFSFVLLIARCIAIVKNEQMKIPDFKLDRRRARNVLLNWHTILPHWLAGGSGRTGACRLVDVAMWNVLIKINASARKVLEIVSSLGHGTRNTNANTNNQLHFQWICMTSKEVVCVCVCQATERIRSFDKCLSRKTTKIKNGK